MTQATQTTLGEIKLAGDLAGTAEVPALSNTGVTAGTYVFPTITVNGKGRITSATSGSSEDIRNLIPGATKTKKGIVQVGDNIEVTNTTTQGYTLISFGGAIVGTADSGLEYDPCRPYTFKLNYTDGTSTVNKTISYSPGPGGVTFNGLITALNTLIGYSAVSIVAGNIRFVPNSTGAGSFINLIDDCLFKYLTGYTSTITTDFGADSSTIWVKEASVSDFGVIKVGAGLSATGGVLSFDSSVITKATSSILGTVKVGSGLNVASGVISVNPSSISLPKATDTTLGVVSVGDGIAVAGDGKISVTLPDATTTTKGVLKVGPTLTVTAGEVNVPYASYTTHGIIKPSNHFTVTDGVLGLNTSVMATESTPGLVKIGTGLVASNGVISVDTSNLPAASKSAKGAVKIGANIDVADGVISAPIGSTTTKGVVKIDTSKGFLINASGQLSMSNASILASTTNTGLVRIGSNIGISNGVISVDVPDATTSSKGKVQVGSGINVTSGTISIPTATTTTKGILSIGSGLAATNGVVSADWQKATTSAYGVVKIGDNIDVSNGVISVPKATATTAGIVKIGSNLLTNSLGEINVNTTLLPHASASGKGLVQLGAGLTSVNGLVSLAPASTTTAGVVKAGTGLNVTNGYLNLNTASASSTELGVVQIGSGINVNNGVISVNVPSASQSVKGIMKVGSGLTATDGIVSVDTTNMAIPSIVNNWTKGQIQTVASKSFYTGTNVINLEDSNMQYITLEENAGSHNFSISSMTATVNGEVVPLTGRWTIVVRTKPGYTNSAFGTWPSQCKFENGTVPTLTAHATKYVNNIFIFNVIDNQTILVSQTGRFEM